MTELLDMNISSNTYRGRFAPSPTGPLHFGSLVAAVGSYLDARSHDGEWLIRIEDLDPPREVYGASREILDTLKTLGMESDAPVIYQSGRSSTYESVLADLNRGRHIYPCACSRKEITDSTPGGHIYPGTCRNGLPPDRNPRSLRVKVNEADIRFVDRLYGKIRQQLDLTVGDFVVRRADQLTAYQLAVVVDDARQNITHVVRGSDLLDSTPRQIHLQRLLGYPVPEYLHLPIAVNASGEKLSKQTGATAVTTIKPSRILTVVLEFLGQKPPRDLRDSTLAEFWQWGIENWDPARIPVKQSLPAPE